MISKYIGKGLFGALLILLLSLGVTRGEGLPGVKVMTLPSSVAGVPGGSLWPSRPGLDEQVASLPLFNPGAKPDLSWACWPSCAPAPVLRQPHPNSKHFPPNKSGVSSFSGRRLPAVPSFLDP